MSSTQNQELSRRKKKLPRQDTCSSCGGRLRLEKIAGVRPFVGCSNFPSCRIFIEVH